MPFISGVGLVFVDWEYGVELGHWDKLPKVSTLRDRVIAINSVNSSHNTLSFNWYAL
jgi:hypothetical protein